MDAACRQSRCSAQQRAQDQRGIVVVDAVLVAVPVARRGEVAHRLGQRFADRRPVAAGSARSSPSRARLGRPAASARPGIRRGTADGDLGLQRDRARTRAARASPRLSIGSMKSVPVRCSASCVAARQQGQVERLRVDAEAVTRPELDDVAAALEQVAAVAQRAHAPGRARPSGATRRRRP